MSIVLENDIKEREYSAININLKREKFLYRGDICNECVTFKKCASIFHCTFIKDGQIAKKQICVFAGIRKRIYERLIRIFLLVLIFFFINATICDSYYIHWIDNSVVSVDLTLNKKQYTYSHQLQIGFNKIVTPDEIKIVFIPPIPTRFSYEPDYNWYRTQYGTKPNGNCGPACVAMAIHWATGRNVGVQDIRNMIGLPFLGGEIDYVHMMNVFSFNFKMQARIRTIRSFDEVRQIINSGGIIINCFDTRIMGRCKGNIQEDYFGLYYPPQRGHYVVIHGYSLDEKWFVVCDPMPTNWFANEERYGDGDSMIGRNRYYKVRELMCTLDRYGYRILEVRRDK